MTLTPEGKRWGLYLSAALLAAGCTPKTPDALSCGDNTTRDGARCVGISQVTCAAGTSLKDGACVPDATTLITCGAHQHLDVGQCVIDATACDTGTTLMNGRCVVIAPTQPVTRWLPNVKVCPEGVKCYDGTIAVDGKGGVFVAYAFSDTTELKVGVSVSKDDGLTFSEKKTFSVDSRYAIGPTVAADALGNVFVAYNQYEPDQSGQTNGTGNLYVVRSSDSGETWSTPSELTAPGDTLDYTPLLSFSGTTLTAVWVRYSNSDVRPLLARSTDLGVTWSPIIDIPGDPGMYGRFTFSQGAATTAAGNLLLGYQSVSYDPGTGGYSSKAGVLDIALDTTANTATSSQYDVKKLNYGDNQLDSYTAVAVNAAGQHCLTLVDAPSRDYGIYGLFGAEAFTDTSKAHYLDVGPGQQINPSVSVDTAGNCHLAWLDNRSGEWALWSATVAPDGTLQNTERISDHTFIEDATHYFNSRTSLSLTPTARYAIWYDSRDDGPGVYFSRGPIAGTTH